MTEIIPDKYLQKLKKYSVKMNFLLSYPYLAHYVNLIQLIKQTITNP